MVILRNTDAAASIAQMSGMETKNHKAQAGLLTAMLFAGPASDAIADYSPGGVVSQVTPFKPTL